MKLKTFLKWVVWMLAVWLGVSVAQAQTLTTEGHVEGAVWAASDDFYQHTFEGGGEVEFQYEQAFAEVFMDLKWWGHSEAKIPGSFLNAEAGKVIQRWHGVNAGLTWRGVQVGLTVRRDHVQHIWEFRREREGRSLHFPFDDNAQNAQWRCRNVEAAQQKLGRNNVCPSIGYHDATSMYLGFERDQWDVSMVLPAFYRTGKTLPWPDWVYEAEFSGRHWGVVVHGQAGGITEPTLDLHVRRNIQELWFGVKVGRIEEPGWNRPLDRIAVFFRIQK